MPRRLRSAFAAIAVLCPLSVFGVPNLEQEYEQVSRIARRDPKVKAAFENADQRLEAKIIEIDPALKEYVKNRSKAKPATIAPATESTAIRKPFMQPVKPKVSPMHGSTHVIATGDTLSAIAARYQVSVAALKAANPVVDEKKLQIGEKLIIPSSHTKAQSHSRLGTIH